ncbi:P-loop containing nucleoside triphosphate hydrolase protein [Xylaria scruposa]|nr:P-loop containing nucleoside triphosphate hydrolase protein [Xylaria scruposa]
MDAVACDNELGSDSDNNSSVSHITPNSSGSSADSPIIPPVTPPVKLQDHRGDNDLSHNHPYLDNKQFNLTPSNAQREWARRKSRGEKNEVIDELMGYVGLEGVKQQFLDIKSKVDICKEQGRNLASERFSIVLQGNPGTGKTTIARLYGRFLESLNIFQVNDWKQEEVSGIEIVNGGPNEIENRIKKMTKYKGDGGVLIVDEAYQLISPQAGLIGRSAIDTILTMMETRASKLAIVFLGYKEEMEAFFEHNPGISSRIPYAIDFDDFMDHELWKILCKTIADQYNGKMEVEGGMGGLYMRCIIRRLSAGRGKKGFGNARAVQNLLSYAMQRQARRLVQEKRDDKSPNCYLLTGEDLLGPDPSTSIATSPAWSQLQDLIGLDQVKSSVKGLIDMMEINHRRELHDFRPIAFSLNQVFVGEPGTGKTTVAKLYGQILAELGYLSRGDVVSKTASDFIGDCLGKSETQTRRILQASVGKVLIIDEAYMLDPGSPYGDYNKFKAGVLDTIVSMVQGQPFEDRCIILVGYEDRINTMFRNANAGLSRRFPHNQPFRFLNFTIEQLSAILHSKLREQDLECSKNALAAAREIFKKGTRGSHTNAGVVDKALRTATMNYSRRIRMSPDPQNPNPELEAVDFDLNLISTTRINVREIMHGQIDGAILDQLEGYQKRHWKVKELGISPEDLELMPTRFLFKGPPGTGKTTTAHIMARLFFEMDYLSVPEVVEYAATDLVGQYVGQTGHRTQEKLRDAVGRLVFIDASRILDVGYGTEAVNELTRFLSQPTHQRNIVVVLAGDKEGLDKMMRLPAVSSVFSEEVTFNHIPPEDCISLLGRELASHGIVNSASFTFNPESPTHNKMKRLFSDMQSSSSWGNARDVKNLARQILGKLFELPDLNGQELEAQFSALVVECMERKVKGQKWRHGKTTRGHCSPLQPHSPTVEPISTPISCFRELNQAPPALTATECDSEGQPQHQTSPEAKIDMSRNTGDTNGYGERSSRGVGVTHARIDTSQRQVPQQNKLEGDRIATREDGVSDATWERVQKANTAAIEEGTKFKDLERRREKARKGLIGGEGAEAKRLQQEYDAIDEEYVKALTLLQHREKIQEALRKMGRCVNGYAWTRDGGGYRCEGGRHYVSDAEVFNMVGPLN